MSETAHPAFLSARRLPNLMDLVAGTLILAGVIYVASIARGTIGPLDAPEATAISLDPLALPGYAVRTTLRMFAALVASLFFTFTYATWAAKSRRAGLILVPVLDILQSVPILGFLTFTVVFFMSLFPGRVLGAELAAIFAIFTSQAWNMAFSLYQSLKTVPADLDEAASSLGLGAWQRFWRLEVPFAMPGLVWNTMMSMSGGWFFVVASEAVSVGDTTWTLPGIGSYVALALEHRDIPAVFYAIGAMLVVILAYDQLLFRPLVAWSAKFRFETDGVSEDRRGPLAAEAPPPHPPAADACPGYAGLGVQRLRRPSSLAAPPAPRREPWRAAPRRGPGTQSTSSCCWPPAVRLAPPGRSWTFASPPPSSVVRPPGLRSSLGFSRSCASSS